MPQLKTASVLAFERNLDISDAIFMQQDGAKKPDNTLKPVLITEKPIRGTTSNRLKNAIANDPTKLNVEIQEVNLQRVDVAALDHDCDTLVVKWSCKVLPFSGKPCVCNNQDYQKQLVEVIKTYLSEHGVKELAMRYATNIANARWLWRNRMGAKNIHITIEYTENNETKIIEFNDAKKHSLNAFDTNNKEIQALAKLIEQGLMGEKFIIFNIKAFATVGYAQEVYPSQELILDPDKGKSKSKKSKVLYQLNGYAAMHSQKISNAIRTIDTWYPDAQFPIAIEPYGAVTTLGTAFRQPKAKQDFYSIFDKWVLAGEQPEIEQQHYVIATLIRGGVFGASGKE